MYGGDGETGSAEGGAGDIRRAPHKEKSQCGGNIQGQAEVVEGLDDVIGWVCEVGG